MTSTPTHGSRVVTLGESLGIFMGDAASPLRVGSPARFSFAGAEGNVSIGLARLGHAVSFVTRVGADDIGRMIVESMRGEGVDVDHVVVDGSAPTALMIRQHRTGDVLTVAYYRAGAAGSRLSRPDLPEEVVRGARLFHVSGITAGLSDSARRTMARALEVAHEAGALVSLDVNHRATLWSVQSAGEALRPMLEHVDVVFGGDDELCLLVPGADVDEAAATILRGQPSTVVRKRGADGATAYGEFGRIDVPALAVTLVDPVGAGDAFVAGYLSALLDGEDVPERLARAVECGAFVVSVRGDWEGAPRRAELGMLARAEQVHR